MGPGGRLSSARMVRWRLLANQRWAVALGSNHLQQLAAAADQRLELLALGGRTEHALVGVYAPE
jgi:hypothetical protein